MPASRAADGARRAQIPAERRSCQLIAVLSGRPVARSQASTVSPWLASATASAAAPAVARAFDAGGEHRPEQFLRVGLGAPVRGAADGHGDFGAAEDLVAGPDQQRLRRGRALVDREDVQSRSVMRASAPCAPGSVRMARGSSSQPTA